jgi:hypothetical protein
MKVTTMDLDLAKNIFKAYVQGNKNDYNDALAIAESSTDRSSGW